MNCRVVLSAWVAAYALSVGCDTQKAQKAEVTVPRRTSLQERIPECRRQPTPRRWTAASMADESIKTAWIAALSSDDADGIYSVAVDSERQHIFAVGQYRGEMTWEGKGKSIRSRGESDVFVVTTTAAGKLVKLVSIGGTGAEREPVVASDREGNVIVMLTFSSPIDLLGKQVVPDGKESLLIAKLGKNGQLLWHKLVSSSNAIVAAAAGTDRSGDIIVAGHFQGAVELGEQRWDSLDDVDGFALRLAPDGSVIWGHHIDGMGWTDSDDVAVDAEGNAFVVGGFESSVAVGDQGVDAKGGSDGYVLQVGPLGRVVGVRAFGGTGADRVNSVAIAPDGQIYIAGFFSGTVGFAGKQYKSRGGFDAFVLRLAGGEHGEQAYVLGGTGRDCAREVVVGQANVPWVVGNYEGVLHSAKTKLDARAPSNLYLAKLGQAGLLHIVTTLHATSLFTLDMVSLGGGSVALGGSFAGALATVGRSTTSRGDIDTLLLRLDLPKKERE